MTCSRLRRQLIKAMAGGPLLYVVGCRSAAEVSSTGHFRLTLVGQSLLEHSLCANPYPGFFDVVAEIQTASLAFTNLEVAIRTPASGKPTRDNIFLHVAEPEVLDCLNTMGFGMLSLSNNHAWDLSSEGVLATRDAVARAGFAYAGTGRDIHAASAAGYWNGSRVVALVAAATGRIHDGAAATPDRPGLNELRFAGEDQPHPDDEARYLGAIAVASRKSDLVIAYLHNHQWGADMTVTRPWIRQFTKRCVDAGADVFVSHGAPVLHGIEIYKGKPILHGLGSLVFHTRTDPGHYAPIVWQSAIVHVDFAGDSMRGLTIVPLVLNEMGDDPDAHLETRGRPRIATGDLAGTILGRLQSNSADMGTSLSIDGERATLAAR